MIEDSPAEEVKKRKRDLEEEEEGEEEGEEEVKEGGDRERKRKCS